MKKKISTFVYKYILLKPLWVNVVWSFIILGLVFFIFYLSLDYITYYGRELKVPNVLNLRLDSAQALIEKAGFSYEIFDSIFESKLPPDAVIKQDPIGNEIVKYGRRILLTVNRRNPPTIDFPNIKGFTLESASLYLQSLGLKINRILYRNDENLNIVLGALFNNDNLSEGEKLKGGSKIDLLVGNGFQNIEIEVPNLIGLDVRSAIDILNAQKLKLGQISSSSIILDTMSSFIIGQTPTAETTVLDSLGQPQPVKNKIKTYSPINIRINSAPFAEDTISNQTQNQ